MNVTLEKWKAEEYTYFFTASNDDELYKNMSDDFPKTAEDCKGIVEYFSQSDEKTEYIRAIKIDGKIIGNIAAFFDSGMYRKNAEMSYWLAGEYRGKGIMPEVIKEFTEDIFAKYDIHRIGSRPFARNKASRRALEKAGFTWEGTLREDAYKSGEFLDSAIYALVK